MISQENNQTQNGVIDALSPFDTVLEVGIDEPSTSHIQSFKPKQHIIIERREEVAFTPMGVFDVIFFYDHSRPHKEQGNLALQKGKQVLDMAKKELPELTRMRYSDQDLEQFFRELSGFGIKEMSRFLSELKHNGQISEEQFEKIRSKYDLIKEEIKSSAPPQDEVFNFLEVCLKDHMAAGSRFCCFSNDTASRYESPQFFEHIITHPNLDYQEKMLSDNRLAIIVTKL